MAIDEKVFGVFVVLLLGASGGGLTEGGYLSVVGLLLLLLIIVIVVCLSYSTRFGFDATSKCRTTIITRVPFFTL